MIFSDVLRNSAAAFLTLSCSLPPIIPSVDVDNTEVKENRSELIKGLCTVRSGHDLSDFLIKKDRCYPVKESGPSHVNYPVK